MQSYYYYIIKTLELVSNFLRIVTLMAQCYLQNKTSNIHTKPIILKSAHSHLVCQRTNIRMAHEHTSKVSHFFDVQAPRKFHPHDQFRLALLFHDTPARVTNDRAVTPAKFHVTLVKVILFFFN